MQLDEQEERLLRSVALQNAQAVLFAREKAERELLATREALKASNQQVTAILERISEVGEFDVKPGTGIAVQIDVEDAVGIVRQADELKDVVEGEL